MRVKVRVPATSANLGPGFDSLGMALDLYNYVEMETTTGGLALEVVGEGAGEIPRDESNLVFLMTKKVFQEAGQAVPGLAIRLTNGIPLARGLGSSAAAIVGGLVAANELAGRPLGRDALLTLALQEEGHADNITAALTGGVTAACIVHGAIRFLPIPVANSFTVVVVIPDYHLSTRVARSVLPDSIAFSDAVHNIGRVALLVAALTTGRWQIMDVATQDRLHQPFRQHVLPGMAAAFDAAQEAGAKGAVLSGSGPTILAFAQEAPERVLLEMRAAYAREGIATQGRICRLSPTGAEIIA
ncbi:MAG: homoserine kinase [Firmicutes bacterium]|nr:homoserine kinase [Bacillota bacterium]MCL5038350.1 homoserine kinase [Bacillota bacterium]